MRARAWNTALDRLSAHDHARRAQVGEIEADGDDGTAHEALYDALLAYHIGAIAPIACPCLDCGEPTDRSWARTRPISAGRGAWSRAAGSRAT